MVDELSVRAGGGVVELVDDDVFEGVRAEVSEVGLFSERLDRGEEDVGGRVFVGAGVEAEGGFGSYPTERIEGLAQDLLAVGERQPSFQILLRVELHLWLSPVRSYLRLQITIKRFPEVNSS